MSDLRRFAIVSTLVGTISVSLPGSAAAQSGAIFVVDSSGDASDSAPGNGVCASAGGVCTLRAALQEANALAGHDTIQFAIGSGVQTIAVGSALPTVAAPVTIDGTTQPGFAGSPIVVVDGAGVNGTGLVITGTGATVRGLVVIRFARDGIEARGADHVFETNYVGMGSDGTAAAGNGGIGILLQNATGVRIGGPAISQRNVISGNTGKGAGGGIMLSGGGNHTIQGNFIGTDVTGMLDRGNEGRGIAISGSSNNLIGGPVAGAGNLISGNRATGVRMLGGSHNNTVQANFIGVNRTVTDFISNDRGVQIRSGNNNQVLGNLIAGQVYDGVLIWESSVNNLIQGNLISHNGRGPTGDVNEDGYAGVWIAEGTGNRLVGNAIHSNNSIVPGTLGGIIIGMSWGPLANDAGDVDTGANQLQNYPLLTSAVVSGAATVVTGTLNSAPATAFVVEFFATEQCDASGFGPGRNPLGVATVTTNGAGTAAISSSLPFALPRGWVVTSTATDSAGNTSGFSACTIVR